MILDLSLNKYLILIGLFFIAFRINKMHEMVRETIRELEKITEKVDCKI